MYKPRDYVRYLIEGKAVITDEGPPSFSLNGDLLEIAFQGFAMISNSAIELERNVRFEITSSIAPEALIGKAIVKDVKEIRQKTGITYRIGMKFTELNKDLIVGILDRLNSNVPKKMRGICYNADEQKRPYSR